MAYGVFVALSFAELVELDGALVALRYTQSAVVGIAEGVLHARGPLIGRLGQPLDRPLVRLFTPPALQIRPRQPAFWQARPQYQARWQPPQQDLAPAVPHW